MDKERVSGYIVRFIVSEREYAKVAERVSCKYLPRKEVVKDSGAPFPHRFVRKQTRLFVKVYVVLAAINGVSKLGRVVAERRGKAATTREVGIPAARIALSITSISALYRVAYALLDKLHMRQDTGKKREKVCRLLVPAVSGLIAGAAYGVYPKEAARGYIGLIVASKAAEFIYNYLDDEGYLEFKPRLLGSWALFPLSLSQLYYTFIFHPDCCPKTVSSILFRLSDGYIPDAPTSFSSTDHWPSPEEVVSSVAEISRQRYPAFESPILFPDTFRVPEGLESIEPVISMAHPAITTLTGALMHPYQRSEFRTYLELILRKMSSVSKYVFAAYAISGLLRSKGQGVGGRLGSLATSLGYSIRTTIFIVMTAASAWSGVGVMQKLLGRNMLPLYRYRVIGFMAGLWAFVDQVNGHARYMYAARLAVLSYWNTLVKQGRVKPLPYGDVALFAFSFSILMTLLDHAPGSISGPTFRKALSWIKSDQSTDPCDDSNDKSKVKLQ
ncbi:hypothetical protein TRICI_002400 [Trichomonascus ciferrii]|uniref:Transmembrane protein 135 N-terminal domain-containing protein n=1 Tax=Trichomonascus ciferrii TaxID=44093 RepID=A0A642V6X0_9ASCO|nr:hypothetical protein TRICI_002400 [Trichomonascus ciferrii]